MKTVSLFQFLLALVLFAALLALPACGSNAETGSRSSSSPSSSVAGQSEPSKDLSSPDDESQEATSPEPETSSEHPGSTSGSKPSSPVTSSPASSATSKPTPAPSTPPSTAPSAITALTPLSAASYYGRSKLSGNELTAYDRIVSGIEKESASINLSSCKLTQAAFEKVLNYYRADYPQHFWVGNEYNMKLSNHLMVSFEPQYLFTGTALANAKKDVDAAVQAALSQVSGSWSEYDRERVIHDWLCGNVSYVDGKNAHNLYGVFVEKKAVCEGYAKAMQYLLYQSGIQCLCVTGMSAVPNSARNEAHAWNIVRISKEYYHVDVTWDDQESNLFHAYLNLTDEQIQEDHTMDSDNYPLPACTATANAYAVKSGCLLSRFDVSTVGKAIRSGQGTASFFLTGAPSDFLTWFEANMVAIAQVAGYTGGFSYSSHSLGHEVIMTMTAK